MKIAIPYENGQVFQHFGHSAQFKLYTAEEGRITGAEVLLLHCLKVLPHFFHSQHPQRKGAQRHQIVQHLIQPAINDVGAQQHDIAGLGIGKHLAPKRG